MSHNYRLFFIPPSKISRAYLKENRGKCCRGSFVVLDFGDDEMRAEQGQDSSTVVVVVTLGSIHTYIQVAHK